MIDSKSVQELREAHAQLICGSPVAKVLDDKLNAVIAELEAAAQRRDALTLDVQELLKQLAAVTKERDSTKADLYEIGLRHSRAERLLEQFGFRRCDIAACNCNSYHEHERRYVPVSELEATIAFIKGLRQELFDAGLFVLELEAKDEQERLEALKGEHE